MRNTWDYWFDVHEWEVREAIKLTVCGPLDCLEDCRWPFSVFGSSPVSISDFNCTKEDRENRLKRLNDIDLMFSRTSNYPSATSTGWLVDSQSYIKWALSKKTINLPQEMIDWYNARPKESPAADGDPAEPVGERREPKKPNSPDAIAPPPAPAPTTLPTEPVGPSPSGQKIPAAQQPDERLDVHKRVVSNNNGLCAKRTQDKNPIALKWIAYWFDTGWNIKQIADSLHEAGASDAVIGSLVPYKGDEKLGDLWNIKQATLQRRGRRMRGLL